MGVLIRDGGRLQFFEAHASRIERSEPVVSAAMDFPRCHAHSHLAQGVMQGVLQGGTMNLRIQS